MTIYFCQASGGGPIKFGASGRVDLRIAQIGASLPQGADLIATVPGYLVRESYFKAAMAPWILNREWLRSEVAVWRVIVAAVDAGDIDWLPVALISDGERHQREKVYELADGLGIKPPSKFECVGSQVLGRFYFATDLKAGRLPQWILAAHNRVQHEVAA